MRKKMCALMLIFVIVYMSLMFKSSTINFEIYNSFKIGSDNYESVILQVIIRKRSYGYHELFEQIYSFYCSHNEPNKLTINLYENVEALKNGKVCSTQIYNLEE